MGNYGNKPAKNAKSPEYREQMPTELLRAYVAHLNTKGITIVELTDAVADNRIAYDHPLGLQSTEIYPVRHTPDQVGKCASAVGVQVIDKKLCVSYGHQPRTTYCLKKG